MTRPKPTPAAALLPQLHQQFLRILSGVRDYDPARAMEEARELAAVYDVNGWPEYARDVQRLIG